MGRRRISLVALVTAACIGCVPELPRGLSIESSFSPEEAALASEAIERANAILGVPLLGHDVLIDLGRSSDPDGFQFHDFGDDVAMIYPLDPASEEYRWLADSSDRDYKGYATLADVLVVYRLPAGSAVAERKLFRQIVMHELGHFLGLPHTSERNSIMYTGSGRLELDSYTQSDQRTFCLIYGC
jgi:hypothetical protein